MRHRSRAGFMMLEVICATALIGAGLYVLIMSLNRCVVAAKSIQDYTIAENLLGNECYIFRVERLSDMDDSDGTFTDYPGFSWARRLEATDTEGLWQQTITVSWDQRGQLTSVSAVEYRYLPEKETK